MGSWTLQAVENFEKKLQRACACSLLIVQGNMKGL